MSDKNAQLLTDRLVAYKRKYYTNLLLRGSILTGSLVLSVFLLVNAIEYFGRLNTTLRGILFFIFLGTAFFSFIYWVVNPILRLIRLRQQLTDEEAARQIGVYFSDIKDKLLNTVQLQKDAGNNALLAASIEQRTQQLGVVDFADAVQFKENNRFLKYLFIPGLLILFISIFEINFFTESSARIVNFSRQYAVPAPFSFFLKNNTLEAFKDEDFIVELNLKGSAIPSNIFMVLNGRKYKMQTSDNQNFNYLLSRLQKDTDFYFEAAGFNSDTYTVKVKERPSLLFFDTNIIYPAYLKKQNETLKNVGNLVVPEGTQIKWKFNATGTENLFLQFQSVPQMQQSEKVNNSTFSFTKKALKSENYQIKLKNEYSTNKENISYYLEVIPDLFPKITVEQMKDTTLFNFLVLGGSISDDYGLSRLNVFYKIMRKNADKNADKNASIFQNINIPINYSQSIQNFYYQWGLDSLKLNPGDKIEYFVQVWDNDGVNGAKSARSSQFLFEIPDEKALEKDLEAKTEKAEKDINKSLNQVNKLQKDIENLENRIKSKKSLDYQDKKMIEDLISKKQELNKQLEQLKNELKDIKEKRDRFTEQSPKLTDKVEQLQKLMDKLLDEETKKLYDELQKLLEQNRNNNTNDLLEKIQKKEVNLEKEIERALEMFKQLEYEQKVEKEINDLKKMAEEQEKLSEKTQEKDTNQEELKEKQEELNQKFEETKEDLKNLEKENKELENPNETPDTKEEQQEIDKQQDDSKEQLDNKENKKASQAQKKAAQQMKQMAQKMEQSMEGQEMEQNQENIDDLRKILENLITLSFDQEKLMKEFRGVNSSDPKFIKLSQEQLKLKDDAKIIEDSLFALSKRVFQIESFVTREVSQMKEYMDESVASIKQRKTSTATGKQQLAMTSMNNLALLLDDVLQQMQNQMQQQQQKGKGKKKGKQQNPGMSTLQQELNKKIQQLKQSGKTGKELSEELGKLAQEQEAIRRMMQQMKDGGKNQGEKGQGDNGLEEMIKQMEQTEKDLVNKNINEQTLKRQQEILTRMLESEKSQKEQDEEETRKAEQAKDKPRVSPAQFEQYIKQKQKQTEFLKTVPPALSPYYKKEVDKYFKKIE
jgi:hypothetical protein